MSCKLTVIYYHHHCYYNCYYNWYIFHCGPHIQLSLKPQIYTVQETQLIN